MNNCTFIGRLSNDPELRYTPNGVAVANFNLAVQDKMKNQSGDYGVTYIDLVAWKGLAETIANHCKKGDQIGVVARYQKRSYEKDGKKVYISEFVVSELTFCQKRNQSNPDPFINDGKSVDISDDSLPF